MAPDSALGDFELIVLMAVLRLGDRAYAPAIREEIETRTARATARGAVYITLDRLEDKALLRSNMVVAEGGGRPKRYYRVSARGVRAVKSTLSKFARMREGLEPLLDES